MCRCGKLINYNQKYCNQCSIKHKQERAEYHRHYDKYIRDKKATDFYNSVGWRRVRDYVIAKYKGLDLFAFFILKEIVYADAVHHIEELKENWDRRLDINNLIPLSNSNHNVIDGLYRRDKEGTQKLLFSLLDRWREEYE